MTLKNEGGTESSDECACEVTGGLINDSVFGPTLPINIERANTEQSN
jgi:hypothetical protein